MHRLGNHTQNRSGKKVTTQSLLGGLFYLASAILAWGEFVAHRDKAQAMRQAYFVQNLRSNEDLTTNKGRIP
jgi:hypothetical protein